MLEFAREHWLWLFALLAVFYVAWYFARRYRKRRVTYAAVWHRVAGRMLPPAWKRILRAVLTLLVATAMLASVVLYAAGLQRATADQPAPLLLIIALDNSVSMRAQAGASTRRELAQSRAQAVLAGIGDADRAVVAHFRDGRPVLGPWLRRGDDPGPPPPTDFATHNVSALARAARDLPLPPGMADVPKPRRLLLWLGDAGPPRGLQGIELIAETFGGYARNDAVTARFTPPAPGETHGGTVDTQTLSGNPARVTLGAETWLGPNVQLPQAVSGGTVRIAVAPGDALPDDDAVAFELEAPGIRRVALCYPAADGEHNPRLLAVLETLLPGREFELVALPGPQAVRCDLLVGDRVLPPSHEAGALLLFGVAGAYGRTGAPINSPPGMRADVARPQVGFEVPSLALVHAREAIPLEDSALLPLERHIEGHVLVAVQRNPVEVLYCGFIPHESTLLDGAREGPLLLLRWLDAVQQREPPPAPPLVTAGEPVTLRLPGKCRLCAQGWADSYSVAGYEVTPGADGTALWTAPNQPGRWQVMHNDALIGSFEVVWSDPAEQSLAYERHDETPMAVFAPPERQSDWRDLLPSLLLWLALALVTLEWVLWLVGVLD